MVEDSQKGKYLIFLIDNEEYGIEISYVIEIIGIQKITKLPREPSYIKGLMNLRGKIIPVMDVRIKLKKEERQYDDRTCIIVVNIDDKLTGLIIDRVLEVISIEENEISPVPNLSNDSENKNIKSIAKIGKNIKLIIDCKVLIQ